MKSLPHAAGEYEHRENEALCDDDRDGHDEDEYDNAKKHADVDLRKQRSTGTGIQK